jgi:hypothetical protein
LVKQASKVSFESGKQNLAKDQTKMCWHAQKKHEMFDSDRTVLVVSAWSYKPGKGNKTHH